MLYELKVWVEDLEKGWIILVGDVVCVLLEVFSILILWWDSFVIIGCVFLVFLEIFLFICELIFCLIRMKLFEFCCKIKE